MFNNNKSNITPLHKKIVDHCLYCTKKIVNHCLYCR